MNQDTLDVVKQGMARVNVNILGNSEIKWMGMGVFNLEDHYIYYCGQESLRRNVTAVTVNKGVWNAITWMQPQEWQNDLSLFPRQTIQITVFQVYAPTSHAEEAEADQFCEDLKTF